MSLLPPRVIELTSSEAFDILAVLSDIRDLLESTEWAGLVLTIEDAEALLFAKLFPTEEKQ